MKTIKTILSEVVTGIKEWASGTFSQSTHTHLKSQVTDLFNSDNTFSGTITSTNVVPSASNTYSLGSASYQYNAIYGKSYYYNGVQWGLDQANVWSNQNTFSKLSKISEITDASQEQCAMNFSTQHSTIFFNTRGSSNYPSHGTFLYTGYGTGSAPERYGQIQLFRSTDRLGETDNGCKPDTSFNLLRIAIHYKILEMMEAIKVINDGSSNALLPLTTRATDLGTASSKWKSLNGINPGALSLPNLGYTADNPDVYNVGTDINNLTKNVSDPLNFSWTSPFDGWLSIMWWVQNLTPPLEITVVSGDFRFCKFGQTWSVYASDRWYFPITFPVIKNVTYYFTLNFQRTSIGVVHHAYLLPCFGNV